MQLLLSMLLLFLSPRPPSNTRLHFGLFNGALNFRVSLSIGDGVFDSDGVTLDEKPIVDHLETKKKCGPSMKF